MSIDVSKIGAIEKACGDRPDHTQPYLRITETVTGKGKSRKVTRTGCLHATDSYIGVSIDVPVGQDETEGVVPLVAIKFAKSLKGEAEVRLIGDRAEVWSNRSEQASFPRGDVTSFPDFTKVTPDGEPVAVFGLNPDLLQNAAAAMGRGKYQALRIEVMGGLRALRVSVSGDDGKRAVVMPVRISS